MCRIIVLALAELSNSDTRKCILNLAGKNAGLNDSLLQISAPLPCLILLRLHFRSRPHLHVLRLRPLLLRRLAQFHLLLPL